jgi:hypothetical protein
MRCQPIGRASPSSAPPEVSLLDVTLRNVALEQADNTFVLESVAALKLDPVTVGNQTVSGELEWKHVLLWRRACGKAE